MKKIRALSDLMPPQVEPVVPHTMAGKSVSTIIHQGHCELSRFAKPVVEDMVSVLKSPSQSASNQLPEKPPVLSPMPRNTATTATNAV